MADTQDIVDLFIKAKREVLRENSKILSSFAGLLWFSGDCAEVTELKGTREFTSADVEHGKTVLPEGAHGAYKSRRFETPRGRVELNDGVPTISIGERFPDKAIDYVIAYMGLNKYRDTIKIIKDPFWDKKGKPETQEH